MAGRKPWPPGYRRETSAFQEELDRRMNTWETDMFASASYLFKIGGKLKERKKQAIARQMCSEEEWASEPGERRAAASERPSTHPVAAAKRPVHGAGRAQQPKAPPPEKRVIEWL